MPATGPYSQDLLTRIYNVQWAGGVFIAADLDSNIYYLKFGGEAPAWQNLGRLEFRKDEEEGERSFVTGRAVGSAYALVDVKDAVGNVIGAKPVFVLVGGSDFNGEIGIIMTSGDGLNWSRAFTYGKEIDPEIYQAAGIFGVVWNEQDRKFYAGGHHTLNFADAVAGIFWTAETDILFQSADGTAWSEVSRHEMRVNIVDGVAPPYPDYKTGFLEAHCGNLVKDANGNDVPAGNYGKSNVLLIAPSKVSKIDYLYGLYLNDIPQGSSSITMTAFGEGIPPSYPSDVGIPLTCIATAAGRWVAAGGTINGSCKASILTSSESGFVWSSADPSGGTGPIITLTGGEISARL